MPWLKDYYKYTSIESRKNTKTISPTNVMTTFQTIYVKTSEIFVLINLLILYKLYVKKLHGAGCIHVSSLLEYLDFAMLDTANLVDQ